MVNEYISAACRIVGSQAALARLLGVSTPTVNQWVKGTRRVPEERCSEIEEATGHRVTCEQLRPDLAAHFSRIRSSRMANTPAPSADHQEAA